jgi:anti-sigma regulatory factor (Ser/Thr protein kinase)
VETVRSGTEWYPVDNASAVGASRRLAIRLATRLGFDEGRTGDVGIVVSEIAANLLKHAGHGSLGLQVALRTGVAGVRVIATDSGPGMDDVSLSAIDGHSTSGTLGVGLGAVLRLSTSVDISTQPRRGTVLCADLWPNGDDGTPAGDHVDIAGLTRPIANEEISGDSVAARTVDGHHLLMVTDGLGHGPMAAGASNEAVAAFHSTPTIDPATMLAAMHRTTRGTRGAAIAVAAIDSAYTQLRFAGVGNISAFVARSERRNAAMSQPGIVGHQMPRIRAVEVPLDESALVIMHSDGVRETWNLRDNPGLERRRASVIAATVLRDAGSRPDDASVLVARYRR